MQLLEDVRLVRWTWARAQFMPMHQKLKPLHPPLDRYVIWCFAAPPMYKIMRYGFYFPRAEEPHAQCGRVAQTGAFVLGNGNEEQTQLFAYSIAHIGGCPLKQRNAVAYIQHHLGTTPWESSPPIDKIQ